MNESKIIKACQAGDKKAFNELITFYYSFILKYLINLTANEEIANDIMQETFLKLITNIDKYKINGKAKFSTYLIAIAKHCYLDYLRKSKKYTAEIDIDTISYTFEAEEFNQNVKADIVIDEINKLPQEQRIAMKLKYLEGLTLKEIAVIQKTKPQTVKSRLHEGKKKIKNKIKGRNFLWTEM